MRSTAALGGLVVALVGLPLLGCASPFAVTVKTGEAPGQLECSADSVRTQRAPAGEAAGAQSVPVRIGFWGDSHIASGVFVDAALREWGVAPSAVRPSFIAASLAVKGARLPLRASCVSPAWRTHMAYLRAGPAKVDFAPGLVALESEAQGAELAWDFRWPSMATSVKAVNLHFGKREPGRSLLLAISLDDGPEKIVAAPTASTEVIEVRGDAPFSTLRLRLVAGQMSLAGVEPVYAQATPAVVDLFAIPGATAEGWSVVSQEVPASYDLVVLEFGTNEAVASRFNPDAYSNSLRRSVARWRQFYPQARCVLITPPDRGGARQDPGPSRRHAQVAVVQRVVARSFGCELWDWQGWMRTEATGKLLQDDRTHLSAQGYEASGKAFAAAIALRPTR